MSVAPKLLQRIDAHHSDVTSLDFFGNSLLVTGSRYFFGLINYFNTRNILIFFLFNNIIIKKMDIVIRQ